MNTCGNLRNDKDGTCKKINEHCDRAYYNLCEKCIEYIPVIGTPERDKVEYDWKKDFSNKYCDTVGMINCAVSDSDVIQFIKDLLKKEKIDLLDKLDGLMYEGMFLDKALLKLRKEIEKGK